MGANGRATQTHCGRGHKMVDPNLLPASNGGRRCRACNRALSQVHNWLIRKGIFTTAEGLDELADKKYRQLIPQD